jgi:ribulose bisphosphate carboxylase small subunit
VSNAIYAGGKAAGDNQAGSAAFTGKFLRNCLAILCALPRAHDTQRECIWMLQHAPHKQEVGWIRYLPQQTWILIVAYADNRHLRTSASLQYAVCLIGNTTDVKHFVTRFHAKRGRRLFGIDTQEMLKARRMLECKSKALGCHARKTAKNQKVFVRP